MEPQTIWSRWQSLLGTDKPVNISDLYKYLEFLPLWPICSWLFKIIQCFNFVFSSQ